MRCSTRSLRRRRPGCPSRFPGAGPTRARRASGTSWPSSTSNFEQFSATPEKVLGADDNHVVVVAKTKGRTKAGGTIEGTAIWIYQLRDGKIADAESFGDTAQVLEALG